jgi:hypothetical protein
MIKLVFCLRRLPTLSVSEFDLVEAGSSPEGRIAGQALRRDEQTFIDLPNSPLFFAREHLIVSANPPHAG